MDWLTAFPMVLDGIAEMAASAMAALAHRLLIIALAALIIGGIAIFAVAGFAWLWLKQSVDELLHVRPGTAAS
ncbi:MAG: hypothetical protein ACM3JG_07870 [Thiohalocapsa sp.]